MDLFIFQFQDAIFSVQETKEKLNEIDLSLRLHSFVPYAMNSRMVERNAIEDR